MPFCEAYASFIIVLLIHFGYAKIYKNKIGRLVCLAGGIMRGYLRDFGCLAV